MQFQNTFEIAGAPADVVSVFEDVPLLASFLPGASVGERRDDGRYPGQLEVAFGPKRLTFKGALTNQVQREQLTGALKGQASADVRGAKMLVEMQYRLSPTATGTRVDLTTEAELTGIVAEFARTGGALLTAALLEDFARRFSEHMRTSGTPAPAVGTRQDSVQTPPRSLSAFGLAWRVLKTLLRRLARARD